MENQTKWNRKKIKWGIFNQTPGFEVFILCSSFCWTEKAGIMHCCFTSAEAVGTVRDVEPRMSTSTFTQFLSSDRLAKKARLLEQNVSWDG